MRRAWLAAFLLVSAVCAPAAAELDVQHYEIHVDVDLDSENITATTHVTALADGADTITLDLVGYDVDSVTVDGLPAPFERRDGTLHITPVAPPDAGASTVVSVDYAGAPVDYVEPWGTWGVVFRADRVFTVNVTHGARHWFPSHDVLRDKATVRIHVTGPSDWTTAAPGLLEQTDVEGDRTTTTWFADFPVATYLIHFGLGRYEVIREEHAGVPYEYYLLPGSWEGGGRALFAHAPAALALFTARYGDYPFPKVAFDEIDLGGAVEQPSCVSIGSQIIQAGDRYDEVIAHEMAHTWFQGVVTVDSWENLWLSEGLATYHEALYHEHTGGDLADYTTSLALSYRSNAEGVEGVFPLYDPEVLFGVTTYRKGALVFHTLSGLLGPEVFHAVLVEWIDRYRWNSAGTEAFREVAEDVSGVDLVAFFDEWVYGKGWPRYELAWRYRGDDGELDVELRQTQPEDWATFTTPITLELEGANDTARVEIAPSGREATATFAVAFSPEGVTLDPDRWLLAQVANGEFRGTADGPDPEPEPTPEPTPEPAPEPGPDVGIDVDGDDTSSHDPDASTSGETGGDCGCHTARPSPWTGWLRRR